MKTWCTPWMNNHPSDISRPQLFIREVRPLNCAVSCCPSASCLSTLTTLQARRTRNVFSSRNSSWPSVGWVHRPTPQAFMGVNTDRCWQDRFTTNYYMPDGSYGNIVSGIYTLASGKVNLLTGNFTLYSSGRSGDLYGAGQSPQTSTLPMPTPWTSTGEGTAIPASEVGETSNYTASSSMASHTTTLPVSDVPTFTSNPAPTETRTATVIHGNAARSVLGGLSEEVLLVALVVCLVSTQHCHYETYHSV